MNYIRAILNQFIHFSTDTNIMISKKSIIIIFTILFLDTSLFYSQLSGATRGKENGGYTFGLSYGGSNQFSDIPTTSGNWGASLFLGKNLLYDEDASFTYDIIGNMTYIKNKGLDIDPLFKPFTNEVLQNTDYDIFYFNYKTNTFTLGFDIKATYNKHRSDQHWYASASLGGNVGLYAVRMNLKDNNDAYYIEQFNKVKNLPDDKKKAKLNEILDGSYETKAEGFENVPFKVSLMPSITLEAGYDITDYLTLFLADKLYFANSNYIDGDINTDKTKDFINYYHVGINYYFHKAAPLYDIPAQNFVEDNEVPGYKMPAEINEHNFPEVKIIQPDERPYVSETKQLLVKAKINNVTSAENVKCKVNGEKIPFEFNKKFISFYADLRHGKNTIMVYVKNEYGMAKDVITVYFNKKTEELSEPEIQLVSPVDPVYKSDDEIFTIKALIYYIKDKNDIKITANGHPFKSYRYNPDTKEFKIKVRLAEGLNRFEITATNEEGKAINSFDIYYKTDIPDNNDNGNNDTGNDDNMDTGDNGQSASPKIVILNPAKSNASLHDTDLLDFEAKVSGVSSKNDIVFTVNGRKNKYFDFDPTTGLLQDKISLFDDVTTIKISATNRYGTTVEETTVRLNAGDDEDNTKETSPIQFVNVTNPDEDCMVNIKVKVDNANSKRQLRLLLNQFEIRNFSFNSNTKLLKSTLYLDEGSNTIKVVFENTDGMQYENTYQISCGQDGDNNSGDNTGDKQAPEIIVLYPQPSSVIENENITLKARVFNVDGKEDIRLKFNDNNVQDYSFDIDQSTLYAELQPQEGENIISISAYNDMGNTSKDIEFTYEPPLAGPPSVMINAPRNRFRTENNSVAFRATVENVKSKEDIYVTFNGKDYRDFNYDEENSTISSVLPLRLGKNTIKVEAENKLGTDSDEVTFEKRIKVLPAVKIIEPKNNNIIISGKAFIKAIVQNVKKKTDAVIMINGKYYRSLNIKNDLLTSSIYLKKGKNEIIVKVANDYGVAADTITLFLRGKTAKPVITFVNPAKSGVTVHNKNFELKVKVTDIKHSSNVTLTVNGMKVDDLAYYKKEHLIKTNIKLKKGWNHIKVIANNESGRDIKEIKIFLE